tara:strand:- start:693 stop:2162 length:1470 start_codon:yes stop_codon:yes gene_type:complete
MFSSKRIFPQLSLRNSDYSISVVSEESDQWMLVHGYSGAVDSVDKLTFEWVQRGLNGPPPSSDVIKHLAKRGYITTKTSLEEQAIVSERAQKLRTSQVIKPTYTIILSYDCNFRCTYCAQRTTQRKGRGHLDHGMSDEMLDSALSFMEATPSDDITLYGGEPFIQANAVRARRLLRWARDRSTPVHCISNGAEWRDFDDVFDPEHISGIQVTLDGGPEIHDRRRVGLGKKQTFWGIIENVEWALKRGIPIVCRVNTDRTNIFDLPELTEILQQRKFYDYDFSLYLAAVTDNTVMKTGALFEPGELFDRVLDVHTEACNEADTGNVLFNSDYLPDFRHQLTQALNENKPLQYRGLYCGAYTSMYTLDPRGLLYACWDVSDDSDNAIGTFFPKVEYFDTVVDRWRGRIDSVLLKDCLTCPYVLLHGSGCQAKAYRENGEYFERDCQEFPREFEIAAKAALGKLKIRTRKPVYPPMGKLAGRRDQKLPVIVN